MILSTGADFKRSQNCITTVWFESKTKLKLVCVRVYIYLTTYSVTTYNFEKAQIYVNVVLLFELYFPEQFKVHDKIERKMQRYLLPSHTCSFPHYQHPLPEWHICYNS